MDACACAKKKKREQPEEKTKGGRCTVCVFYTLDCVVGMSALTPVCNERKWKRNAKMREKGGTRIEGMGL
jgi:hypothetical protein